MTIHIRFTSPQLYSGEQVEEATLEADRILIEDGRLLLLHKGEVRADVPAEAVAEIDLHASKTYSVDEIRAEHAQAYKPWTDDEEQRLLQLHNDGTSIAKIAEELARQPGAVRSRLRRLQGR